MKEYYKDDFVTLYHGESREVLNEIDVAGAVTITDPPYNVGYHYDEYGDNLTEEEYQSLLTDVIKSPCVIIHYPEDMFRISYGRGEFPDKCVSWVYNANTPKQWRMIAWFGCAPDFSKVKQPYKNLTDRRIRDLIEGGSEGTNLYDWWNEEQVKMGSKEKTDHPCQIPLPVMNYIVQITPAKLVVDPFCGSGTTLLACKEFKIPCVGVEIDEKYCEIAVRRLSQEILI